MKSHVDLFSGIGGFSLAAGWADYETVLFVEKDDYCQKVLRKHWPNVPIIGDIRDVNEATVADACRERQQQPAVGADAIEPEGRTRMGAEGSDSSRGHVSVATRQGIPAIDLLTGGFPCQPFSVAGKRGGTSDDRYLWPEMLRVIALLKPRWVLAENVAGITSMVEFDSLLEMDRKQYSPHEKAVGQASVGAVCDRTGRGVLDSVLGDLEEIGYEVGTLVIPACAVNAPHRRDRVWIVAHDTGERCRPRRTERARFRGESTLANGREDVADTDDSEATRQREYGGQVHAVTESEGLGGGCSPDWWAVEPDVGRVADGIPRRVDRLRCLGNAIVPQVAYQIIRHMDSEVSNG